MCLSFYVLVLPFARLSVEQLLIMAILSPYSPIGEIFRARLRQFPSLVNCCTIDWFSAWPEEALRSVASTFLGEIPELEDSSAMDGLVCFSDLHLI